MCGFYPINANRVQQWICSTKGGVKPLYPVGQELQGVCSNPKPQCLRLLGNQTAVQGDRLPSRFHTSSVQSRNQRSNHLGAKLLPQTPSVQAEGPGAVSQATPAHADAAGDAPGHGGVGVLHSRGLRCWKLTLPGAGPPATRSDLIQSSAGQLLANPAGWRGPTPWQGPSQAV